MEDANFRPIKERKNENQNPFERLVGARHKPYGMCTEGNRCASDSSSPNRCQPANISAEGHADQDACTYQTSADQNSRAYQTCRNRDSRRSGYWRYSNRG
jgi:hypothetical protein